MTGPSDRTGAPTPPDPRTTAPSGQPSEPSRAGSDWLSDSVSGDWDAVVRGATTTPDGGSNGKTGSSNGSKAVGAKPTGDRARPATPADPKARKARPVEPADARGRQDASSAVRGSAAKQGSEAKKPKQAGGPRLSRRARRRQRRQQKPSLWRGRILPKTVLGIAFTMLVSGVAMAASGVVLFMNYRYRQDQSDTLVRGFDARTRQATRAVRAEGTNARAQVQQELEPLRKLAATAETLTSVLAKAQPSVYSVRTFDVNGAPTIGSAFVVASDDSKSFLLTSYGVVKAATKRPGPAVVIHKGGQDIDAKLWTWQEDRDLALLIVDKGNLPRLDWAPADSARLGDQVFALSGLGAADASITQGFIADVAATGLQHSAPIGTAFQGGPLLNAQSQVVAMASRSYAPLGFVSDGVYFAPPVRAACDKVLKCPNGLVTAAGDQR